jgi:hypothetical protein
MNHKCDYTPSQVKCGISAKFFYTINRRGEIESFSRCKDHRLYNVFDNFSIADLIEISESEYEVAQVMLS